MLNDLKVDALTWKYVDDTTIETYRITFFMGNCKSQTAKCYVTTALQSRLQFASEMLTFPLALQCYTCAVTHW